MDQAMDGLSMLLVSILILLFALNCWSSPASLLGRRILRFVTAATALFLILHSWFGLIEAPLDQQIVWPITKAITALGAVGLFTHAIRTFVTDWRRATAERLVKEKAGA